MANAGGVDLGTGGSAAFGTSSTDLDWTSISIGSETIDMIETSHLGTTGWKTKIGGDLKEHGDITMEFIWDNENEPSASNVAEVLTITLPQSSGNTTSAATYALSGCITSVEAPTMGVDELMTGSLTFIPDGLATAPTWTPGA